MQLFIGLIILYILIKESQTDGLPAVQRMLVKLIIAGIVIAIIGAVAVFSFPFFQSMKL